MQRDIFSDEHELFRSQFKRFAEAEIEPRIAEWNEEGSSDRQTWRRMGEEGFLGANAPEQYGGAGLGCLHLAIVLEESGRALLPSPLLPATLAAIAIAHGASEAQRRP